MPAPLILASASLRRHQLLDSMQVRYAWVDADVDEGYAGPPDETVLALSLRKAQAVQHLHPQAFILAADTVVYAGGSVLGKPRDAQDAWRMLHLLSGAWHEVHTGVCLVSPRQDAAAPNLPPDLHHEMTRVQFLPLTDVDIAAYIQSGEPFGKAGAYAIQGIAGMYIPQVQGSFSNVVGLPCHAVRGMLRAHGIDTL